MSDEAFMRQAVEVCRRGIEAGQTPFGCVIVKDGRVVAEAHNTVWADTDPSAHAEVNAIRRAARALGSIDLEGCTLYTTCEPCPMCLATSHWAKVQRVVFGASIGDAEAAGFSELPIAAKRMVELGASPLIVDGGVLRDACAGLFAAWTSAGKSRTY